jgi:hypothetical protein
VRKYLEEELFADCERKMTQLLCGMQKKKIIQDKKGKHSTNSVGIR